MAIAVNHQEEFAGKDMKYRSQITKKSRKKTQDVCTYCNMNKSVTCKSESHITISF